MKRYKFVQRVIRSIKKQYGQPITLKNVKTKGTIDWTSGNVSNRDTETLDIKLAAILPTQEQSKFNFDLSYVAANKNFVYGGFYDQSQRDILIDLNDVGDFTIDNNTIVIFNSLEYQIKIIRNYEESRSVHLTVTRTRGQSNES